MRLYIFNGELYNGAINKWEFEKGEIDMHKEMEEILQSQKERMDNIEIDTLDTPEKLCPLADEIVPILATILKDVAKLSEQITKRMNKLNDSKPGGQYSCIAHSDTPALWQEYKERYHALFDPHCTEKLLKRRIDCCQSLGDTDFSALDTDNSKVSFLMKSKGKAIIVVYAENNFQKNYRFVMRQEGDTWKIDEIAFQYLNEEKWKVQRYM